MFDEGFIIYCQVRDQLDEMNGSWKKLSKTRKKKMKMAIDNMAEAAMQGHADAQCNLGVMYSNGRGVKQSYEKAVEWYEKAAKQGDADAQYYLGLLYSVPTATAYGTAAKNARASIGCTATRILVCHSSR